MMNATESAQKHLDSFLVENQEFEILNSRIARFNLFDVLRIGSAEIRHSNVLAWLLTPGDSHGLGNVFLRRFLSRLLMSQEMPDVKLTASEIELADFGDVEVLREWQNIDVLVRSRSGRWCLVIENKINSKESDGQLAKYKARVQHHMPDYAVVLVYLTLDGEDPSPAGTQAGFVPLSHIQVLQLAEQIIEQHANRIPDDARVFLSHYLSNLRQLTMQDEELVELCKTIYRKHRAAIDLIVEYGSATNIHEACVEEIQSLIDCEFTYIRQYTWFMPKDLGDLTPDQEMDSWGFLPRSVPYAYSYRYLRKRGVLELILEVGAMSDSAKRQSLLRAFEDSGIPIRKQAFREQAKFTRLANENLILRKDEDGEPDTSDEEIRRAARVLWKRMLEMHSKVRSVLSEFSWA